MGQPGRHPDLAHEPVAADLGGDLGTEDLDGHLALVAEVVGQEDHGHAAFAELSFDGVAAGERGSRGGAGGRSQWREDGTRRRGALGEEPHRDRPHRPHGVLDGEARPRDRDRRKAVELPVTDRRAAREDAPCAIHPALEPVRRHRLPAGNVLPQVGDRRQ